MFDPYAVRRDFPILDRKVDGKTIVYFDNAATTQKPWQVIEAIKEFYEYYNANIHRGLHTLSQEASEKYEAAHEVIAKFIGARGPENIVFVKNTTEAVNLVAYGWGLRNLREGDEIITTIMEHHSNLLPWHQVFRLTGARLRIVDVDDNGVLRYDVLEEAFTRKTRIVAVSMMSNAAGTINDVERITRLAHDHEAIVVVDGAQGVPHLPVDVGRLDVDFLAFSGHKMLGPTGTGVLYVADRVMEGLGEFIVGGGAIKEVHYTDGGINVVWADYPWRHEAGTPNIAGGIGLAEAARYLMRIGMKNVRRHEEELVRYTFKRLEEEGLLDVLRIMGPMDPGIRGGIVSFTVGEMDPHSTAVLLDSEGIAVRSGFHCAQPLHERLGFDRGSVRASYYLYNTFEEVDVLVDALMKIASR